MKLRHAILTTAFAACTSFTADAALITWGAATGVSGDADVSTAGTLVNAVNIGAAGVGTTTVNGVTFDPLVFGNNVASGNFNFTTASGFNAFNGLTTGIGPFLSLSAPYQTLLSSVGLTGNNTPFALTLSGLEVGASYEFQWWSSNSAGGSRLTTATAGGAVSLNSRTTIVGGGVGQFALGTFIADAPTQVITFTPTAQSGTALIDAAQLRQLAPAPAAVPEPGTALAGVMLAGLVGLRRRRATV